MEKKNLLEAFIDKLRQNNYKLTEQRRDIIKTIISHKHRHFTAEELHEEVKRINPDIGLATIYRSLDLFCDLDFIHRLDFDSDHKYYELRESKKHHHHMICLDCDKIIEFNDEDLINFEKKLEKKYCFVPVNHFIKFFGYCEDCEGGE